MTNQHSEIVIATPVEISPLPENPYPRMDQHPARVYLLRLRPGSRPAQQNVLELFVRADLGYPPPPLPRPRDPAYQRERALWLEEFWRYPWHTLRYQHVAAVQTALTTMKEPPYAHTLVNRAITAMRRVLKEAWKLGWMRSEDYERARGIEKIEGERLPKGRHIEKDEIVEIIERCNEGVGVNQRTLDTATMSLIWGTGCRRGDAASAQYGAYDNVKKTLVVIGKRNKQRKIPLPEAVWKAIDAWILARGTHPGPLFHPVSQSDRVMTDRRIHPRTIGTILDKIVARCTGLHGVRFTSHDFRRTFISNEIDKGTNLSALAKMVGHDDVNTTVGYDLSKERAMRRIADGIKLPTRSDP